jgi:pyrroloquinoline quinone (PQQ) biosynthesis protein C
MEHFRSPFDAHALTSARAVENRVFFNDTIKRAREHRFFSHPFLSSLNDGALSRGVVSHVLTSFYQIVAPFTGLLCSLGGHAPNLQSRFALMDNLYEEMGCGDFNAAHPSLYLKMLASIGIAEKEAESLSAVPAIRRINNHLQEVVERRPFSVACAVLACAESTIPPSFPVLARMARETFRDVDMAFFERHGVRDEGHSDDAAMLFAVSADRSHFADVEADVRLDLDYRSELFDDWASAIANGKVPLRSDRPRPPTANGDGAHRPSVPPPA